MAYQNLNQEFNRIAGLRIQGLRLGLLVVVCLSLCGLTSQSCWASCGGLYPSASQHSGKSQTRGENAGELRLPERYEYIAGHFIATYREPGKPCTGTGCRAGSGLESNVAVTSSSRNGRIFVSTLSATVILNGSILDEGVSDSAIGDPSDGHIHSIEHPPRVG